MIKENGYESLWGWFGLSYASWLTLPRVLMHEMPDKWQSQMAELLKEYDETWNFSNVELRTIVQCRKNKKLIKTPDWLINYRHPDSKTINEIKRNNDKKL